jgi:hypothetical protein
MKKAVVFMELPVGIRQFELEIQEPGIIRQFGMGVRQKTIVASSVITGPDAGKPVLEEVPYILVEVNPDARKVKRQFVVLNTGEVFEAVSFEYKASAASRSNNVFHLYENTSSVTRE